MNIFFLDKNPHVAAIRQCDKHVVKMVLETAQMLSTAARRHEKDLGYKSAYPNHPMILWVGNNYIIMSGLLNTVKLLQKNILYDLVKYTNQN